MSTSNVDRVPQLMEFANTLSEDLHKYYAEHILTSPQLLPFILLSLVLLYVIYAVRAKQVQGLPGMAYIIQYNTYWFLLRLYECMSVCVYECVCMYVLLRTSSRVFE